MCLPAFQRTAVMLFTWLAVGSKSVWTRLGQAHVMARQQPIKSHVSWVRQLGSRQAARPAPFAHASRALAGCCPTAARLWPATACPGSGCGQQTPAAGRQHSYMDSVSLIIVTIPFYISIPSGRAHTRHLLEGRHGHSKGGEGGAGLDGLVGQHEGGHDRVRRGA